MILCVEYIKTNKDVDSFDDRWRYIVLVHVRFATVRVQPHLRLYAKILVGYDFFTL